MNIFNDILDFLKSLVQWWTIISPWEQGIRVRLGKNVTILDPGAHLKIPLIDVMFVQPIRLRVIPITDQVLMTKDSKVIILSGSLGYKIIDLLKLYQTLHDPTDTIEQQVMGIISERVFANDLAELSPEKLMTLVNDSISLQKYGLESNGFFLVSFACVRTYRIISGEMRQYVYSKMLLDPDSI